MISFKFLKTMLVHQIFDRFMNEVPRRFVQQELRGYRV